MQVGQVGQAISIFVFIVLASLLWVISGYEAMGDNSMEVGMLCSVFFLLILSFLGIVFLSLGITSLRNNNKARCQYLVRASYAGKKKNLHGVHKGRSFPVFAYTYGGEEYKAVFTFTSYDCKYKEGDTVELYIDEKQPDVFWSADQERIQKNICRIFITVGLVMLSVASVIVLVFAVQAWKGSGSAWSVPMSIWEHL